MGSVNSGNFTIKFNNTEPYALSGTYNDCNSPYGRYLPFLVH